MPQAVDPVLKRLRESFGSRGFILLGVTDIDVAADHARFLDWLASGKHAGMEFLALSASLRGDLRNILPTAESAVVFALPYGPPAKGTTSGMAAGMPQIAKYARLRDYHKVMWQEGETAFAEAVPDKSVERRVCVDSAPVLERALAAKSGAGFIGKNTCFIAGRDGSFLLLGIVLTSLRFPPSKREKSPKSRANANDCGTCQRCQVHCPTGALDVAWNLDSRKCLSYWTIEHRGTIPEEFWPWLAKYWYGCDICQDVCPYNRTSNGLTRPDLRRAVSEIPLEQVATMSQEFYEKHFGGTAMTRAKRTGLRRNALIAMAVTDDPALDLVLDQFTNPSITNEDETIRETVRQIIGWRKNDQSP